MVYIANWQDFQEEAEALYFRSPEKTRYVVKWKASQGHLVLKITDDTTCLKFKTYSSIFLNRFEALNLSLMEKMQNRRPPQPEATPAAVEQPINASTPTASSVLPSAGGAPAGGGVKKKKPKKKK